MTQGIHERVRKDRDGQFDQYVFADYSGGGLHGEAQNGIRLWHDVGSGPERLYPENGRTKFSRESLARRVAGILTAATAHERRVIFGFDHQYGWPSRLRAATGLNNLDWRQGLQLLRRGGNAPQGLPPLSEPATYCRALNEWARAPLFWSPLIGRAARYGVPHERPGDPPDARFRLTELCRAARHDVNARPKPADAVGGMGEGLVGGQTVCGLYFLADLSTRKDVAWWPFDGLNICDSRYEGKHVGVEIYPSALRSADVPQTDDHDAEHSVLYVREADQAGRLTGLMNLSSLEPADAARVKLEGWIVGMLPARR